jgi:DNA-binding winged helix-turn-helix (wHTH) protein/TolB-like protein
MPQRVQFGVFELDLETAALTRQGVPIRLQPQPARVLTILAGRSGEVVSREDLRREIWAHGTFVDFERGLNFCIAQIRAALGDQSDSPRFIETLPKRGYRFIAPVRELPKEAASSWAGPSSKRRALLRVVAAILVLIAATAALMLASGWGQRARPIRVAVVPFDNQTGQDAFDDIAIGIADATVARLATGDRAKHLRVIGNAAILRRPRSFRDIKAIGEAVHADYVVLAQLERDATHVRLIAHLIRVSDESHVWANIFDRSAFPLDTQAEIAEAIAREVSARLTG